MREGIFALFRLSPRLSREICIALAVSAGLCTDTFCALGIPTFATMRDNRIIRSRHLGKLQRRHFIIFDVVPFLGTLVALALLFYQPIGATEVTLFFGMWLVTGLGLTVGYHRFFTHRAFSTNVVVSCILIVMGSMAGRGPMISWAAMHRRHHELSDHEGDLHSPNLHGTAALGRLRGFLHAHLTWMIEHDYPNVAHYVPDLMAERIWVAANRRYYRWVLLGLLIPAAIGGLAAESLWSAVTGFLWGGVVRMFVVEQSMSAINSVMHTFGARPFSTRGDNSRNLGVMALLAWGEGWHNNHHAFPYSAAFGLRWFEFDPGFLFIRLLETLGLAWNVKVPSQEKIAFRTVHPTTDEASDLEHG
jgi:stearoyl-CoA desaturase (delta-9 desaturase)